MDGPLDGISLLLQAHQIPTSSHLTREQANGARYAVALRAIIERADNGALGSSKVQDMRKLAQEALDE